MKVFLFRAIGSLLTLAALVSATACSYATEFVIVNDSAQVLMLEYRVKSFPGEFAPPENPATLQASQLSSHGNRDWTRLASAQYRMDANHRSVKLSLMPGQALLVCKIHNYAGHNDAWDAQEFPLDQITLSGSNGVLLLKGEEARTRFSQRSRVLFVLDYQ